MGHDKTSRLLVVVSSFPRLEDAQVMARNLIKSHLAACVQIQQDIHSIFCWEGKICEDQEVLLSAKTMEDKWVEISRFIKSYHPYDLPEVLAYLPEKYEEQYGKWVQAEIKSAI